MAPPGDAKIPPAVKQVRGILGSNAKNGKITAEELQGLDKTLLNELANNMRNTLQDGPKKAYKGLKTDAERRDWLAYYCMDPAGAVTKGFNRQLNYDEQISDEATVRITKTQMAGPSYLNDASHVEICCNAGYFEEHPPENKELADMGPSSTSSVGRSSGGGPVRGKKQVSS